MAVSSRIFISYRRDDAPAYAGRLYDQLSSRFGSAQVFMDVDTLEPGVDFVERIEESVGSADVLIAVIGPGWARAVDASGHRRLDEPDDFVRLEVAEALHRNIRVIPVLVGGASMPEVEELPDDLAGLRRRNGLPITDLEWKLGTARLFETIERVLGDEDEPAGTPVPKPDPVPSLPSALLPLGLAGAALLAVGIFMRWDQGHSFLQNNFGTHAPHGGAFTSLAPIGVVVAAVLGTLLARKPDARAFGAGVLFGAGIAGASTYLAILLSIRDVTGGVEVGLIAAFAGGILVVTAGLLAVGATGATENARNAAAAVSGIAGAVVMTVALGIPFNDVNGRKVADSLQQSFGLVVTSAAIAIIAALLLRPRRHVELSSALLTLGVLDALLWAGRYIGIPSIEDSDVARLGAGGFVGLAGAGLVVLGGYLGLRASRAHASPDLAVPAARLDA